jgi:hypothetical protein
MSILQGENLPGDSKSPDEYTVIYTETHATTTNPTGLATLEIGRGTPVSGSFASINWSTTPIFLKTEIDPAGGSAFVEIGTSELLSVPFALFAENTANNDDADADPANELQTVTEQNYQVTLSQGGGSFVGGIKSLTQTEIDLITPYNGLTLHNSTTNCINYYYQNNWFEACGTCTPQPTIPNAGPDQVDIGGSTTTLAANTPVYGTGLWTVVTGEGGSFGDPTSPVSSFTGVPTTDYVLTWTISTPCTSLSDNISIRFWSCGLPLAVNHITTGGVAPVDKSVVYGTVTNIPGETSKCWITSNLGADHQAESVDDANEASAGWYWQFNRKQGFKHDGEALTPNTTWITSIDENTDWTPANDPCTLELGSDWHIPASTEWANVDESGNWTNWNGPWNSGLKMHAAGYLDNSYGSLGSRGSSGSYWSSSHYSATDGLGLYFYGGYSGINNDYKAYGFSLRCLRD